MLNLKSARRPLRFIPSGRRRFAWKWRPTAQPESSFARAMWKLATPRGTERINEGNMMLVRGAADNPEYQIIYAAAARSMG